MHKIAVANFRGEGSVRKKSILKIYLPQSGKVSAGGATQKFAIANFRDEGNVREANLVSLPTANVRDTRSGG